VNTLFAVAYFLVGIDQIHGAEAPIAPARFMNAFFFQRADVLDGGIRHIASS